MSTHQSDIDERTNLAGSNKFEMLMFRLGKDKTLGQSELFGINVFKIGGKTPFHPLLVPINPL